MFESNEEKKQPEKKGFFELIFEIIGWLQIVASPLVLGLIAGSLIYITNPTNTRLIIAIVVACAGLIIGIIWATRIWKRKGTLNFLYRAMTIPKLDEAEDEKESK